MSRIRRSGSRGGLSAGLLVLLVGACAPRLGVGRQAVGELSPMRLMPVRAADEGWISDLESHEHRFGLNLLGLTAEGETVLLHGALLLGGKPYRSLVLTSNDAGVTWQETLAPYENSEITHAQLIGCTGWALAGWRQEALGDLILVGTGDCGKQWFSLSELPRADPSGWPVALEFQDTFNGVITLAYSAPDLERGHLRTQDGGRTWDEVLTRAREAEPGRVRREFTARDGTGWKVDAEQGRYLVRRRPSGREPWMVTSVLPAWLRVEDRELVPLAR